MSTSIDAEELDSEVDIGARRDLRTHPEVAIGVVIANLGGDSVRGIRREGRGNGTLTVDRSPIVICLTPTSRPLTTWPLMEGINRTMSCPLRKRVMQDQSQEKERQ
jgi:hypothetical protein